MSICKLAVTDKTALPMTYAGEVWPHTSVDLGMEEGVVYRSGRLTTMIEERNEEIAALKGRVRLLSVCVWVVSATVIVSSSLCIYVVSAYL